MTDRMDRGQPRTTATRRARHAGRVAPVAAAVVVAVLLGGCSGEASVQVPIRTIQLDDFAGDPGVPARSATSAAPRPAPVVEPDAGSVAGSDTEPEAVADSHSDAVSDSAGDARTRPSPRSGTAPSAASAARAPNPASTVRADDAAGSASRSPAPAAGSSSTGPSAATSPSDRRPTREWIVESLVGQVNGRPIFADEFLLPIADRIQRIVEEAPRADARDAIILLVSQRFDDWVNNELIISEAEAELTPEQQQGLLAWLRDAQEGEIAARGGTRATAEEALQENLGMSIEEYMEQRRNFALTGNLLRQRITPRVIVSWRDIEREYARRVADFGTGATIVIGRIRLPKDDALRIQEVTDAFASGASFVEVARKLELPDDGLWVQYQLGPDGIDGTDLSDSIKELVRPLAAGEAAPPFEQGTRMVWVGILAIEQPQIPDLYDRNVQLALRNELSARREEQERLRYLGSLRERWVQDNIEDMRIRLVEIALKRYWL